MVEGARDTDVLRDDGITVYQTFQPDEFDVPTVAIELVSGREEAVRTALVVELPPDLAAGEVGFHPDHRGDDWSVIEGRLEFQVTVEPDETVTTLYAVDSTDPDQIETLLGQTRLARVERIERDGIEAETLPEVDLIDGGAVDGSGSGSGNVAAGDDQSPSRPDSRSQPGSPDRDRDDGTRGAGPGGTDGVEGAAAPLSTYSTGELVDALGDRTADGDISERDRQRLRALLSGETDLAGLDTRVSHLQQRVSDLEADTEPLRQLRDRRGDLVGVVDALDERLTSLSDRLDAVDERIASDRDESETDGE